MNRKEKEKMVEDRNEKKGVAKNIILKEWKEIEKGRGKTVERIRGKKGEGIIRRRRRVEQMKEDGGKYGCERIQFRFSPTRQRKKGVERKGKIKRSRW